MTSALKPPGGIYWRAALFAAVDIKLPITVGMEADVYPHRTLNISMPIQVGLSTPVGLSINMPIFVGMLAKSATPVDLNISMPIQLNLSTSLGFDVALPITVGIDVKPFVRGQHLNTSVQRAATI